MAQEIMRCARNIAAADACVSFALFAGLFAIVWPRAFRPSQCERPVHCCRALPIGRYLPLHSAPPLSRSPPLVTVVPRRVSDRPSRFRRGFGAALQCARLCPLSSVPVFSSPIAACDGGSDGVRSQLTALWWMRHGTTVSADGGSQSTRDRSVHNGHSARRRDQLGQRGVRFVDQPGEAVVGHWALVCVRPHHGVVRRRCD